jgi:protein-S-isoprenylcysteine O-methyltransferase Ste14
MNQSTSSTLALIGYFAFFGMVHSLLADPRFKGRLRRSLGKTFDRWSRLAFTILALIMISPFICILIFLPKRILYTVPVPFSWLMAAGQALAALAVLGALRQTGVAYFLGLAQLRGKVESSGLVTDGFYCHLRNPLFFFGAIFLWLSPIMTLNLLVFNILATAYFYIGARHEERSLRKEFGEQYEIYRQKVPMFPARQRC